MYELVVFLIVMAAVLIFFFVAAISPNIYVTNPLALGILQVILVSSSLRSIPVVAPLAKPDGSGFPCAGCEPVSVCNI